MLSEKDAKEYKRQLRTLRKFKEFKESSYFDKTKNKDIANVQSSFFDRYTQNYSNVYGNLKTADNRFCRNVSCQTLRKVSTRNWLINLCITHVQKKIRPFLKPSTNRNLRGFVIKKVGEDISISAGEKSEKRTEIEQFLMNTGKDKDISRDDFAKFCTKLVRDVLEIDQIATEIGYTEGGSVYGFWAVDAATIEKVLPDQYNPYDIKYVQQIDSIPQAYYPANSLIFDYQNPRTDVYRSFYGYSYVEQAIDLVTASINTFVYNSGFFTENKLPKGMLLIDGNADQEAVEKMEDYITDMMSGGVGNQWRVPIIPAGNGTGDSNSIKWVSLNGTNREMEFQQWMDYLTSGIVALFGCSMEELGLHSSKSQTLFERNTTPELEASKSLILGDMLSFLQQYINKILAIAYPEYEFEFVGYERDDPKAILEITKGELDSFKTLNEVRQEKGLKPLSAKWADECPSNPQFVQMYQASAGDNSAMPDMEGMGGEEQETENGPEETEKSVESINKSLIYSV